MVDQRKVEAVETWPQLTNVKELQRFLGLQICTDVLSPTSVLYPRHSPYSLEIAPSLCLWLQMPSKLSNIWKKPSGLHPFCHLSPEVLFVVKADGWSGMTQERVLNLCHRQSSPSSAPRKTLTSAGPTTPLVSRSCGLYYWSISVGHVYMCACNSAPFLQSLQTNSLTSAAYCYGNCWNFFQPGFLPLRNTRGHSARPWSNSLTSGYHLQANGQTKRKIQEVGR